MNESLRHRCENEGQSECVLFAVAFGLVVCLVGASRSPKLA